MIRSRYTSGGMTFTDRSIQVPVDWGDPGGRSTTVFAREVVSARRAGEDLPLLVYLQGGPGGKSPRPTGQDGWLPTALERFRVILVDQRGTGRSGRLQGSDVADLSPRDGARLLACYRADSIVADLEALRSSEYGDRRWATLGQSFGGFITLEYLSKAPEALSACYVAGGLASVRPDAGEVYRRTYPKMVDRTGRFYERFPDDRDRIAALADQLEAEDVRLPDGDRLTVRRFQSLGIDLGMRPGSLRLHWLVDEAWAGDEPGGPLTDTFRDQVMTLSSLRDRPLFMVLQESIYGMPGTATRWAAQAERDRRPEFAEEARPLLFTGEMMFPWMLDEVSALRPFAPAARALAEHTDWTSLYDLDRLRDNEVPVAAAVYADDMYVDVGLSLETAALVGNLQAWVTNEFEHDGLHSGGVLPRLFQLVDNEGGPR